MAETSDDAGSGSPAPGSAPPPASGGPAAAPGDGRASSSGDPPKPATLTEIVEQQHGAIVRQVAEARDTYIGVAGYDNLQMRGLLFGGHREDLPGASPDDAFVWINSYKTPELWAAPSDAGYAKYWSSFCKTYYHQDWQSIASGDDWNIDHLFPKGVAKEIGVAYVRLTAVDARGNQRMGHLERQAKDRAVEIKMLPADPGTPARDKKQIFNITEFSLGKVTGFPEAITLPTNRRDFTDIGVITRLIDHVTRHTNIPEPEVIRDLRIMLTQNSATMLQTKLSERAAKQQQIKPFIR